MSSRPRFRRQNLVIGLVLLALGTGLCVGTFAVTALPGQDSLGPRLFPTLIGGGLIILGLLHFWQARAKADPSTSVATPASEADSLAPDSLVPDPLALAPLPPGHLPTLLWVVAGVAIGAAVFKWLGFLLAALIVFVMTARGFAGRFDWRHVLAGAIIALIVYVGFTKGLGLRLPAGIFAGWI